MFSKKKKKERSDGHSKKLMSPTVMSQSAIASSHDDPGYNTGDSSKLPNNISLTHRPSVCSALSDSSTSSYYTATNVPIHDSNQVSSVSTPERPAEISMKELLQSVEVIVHSRITELEQKVEISHRKLEARLDDVEKQIHKMLADAESRLVLTEEQRVVETPVSLPILKEVPEEDDDNAVLKSTYTRSQSLGSVTASKSSRTRRYTDTEPMKMKGHRNGMKWKDYFAKKKSQSLQELLSNKSCDQQVIMWLTDKVQRWKFLARRLELEENELHRIETDNPNNDREQCYQMFLRWKAVYPQNYTYPVLGEALRKESKELYNDYVKQVHRVEGKIILPISE